MQNEEFLNNVTFSIFVISSVRGLVSIGRHSLYSIIETYYFRGYSGYKLFIFWDSEGAGLYIDLDFLTLERLDFTLELVKLPSF